MTHQRRRRPARQPARPQAGAPHAPRRPPAPAAKGEAARDADGADGVQPVRVLHHRPHALPRPLALLLLRRRLRLLLSLLLRLLLLPSLRLLSSLLLRAPQLLFEAHRVDDPQHCSAVLVRQRQLAAHKRAQRGALRGAAVGAVLVISHVVQQRRQLSQLRLVGLRAGGRAQVAGAQGTGRRRRQRQRLVVSCNVAVDRRPRGLLTDRPSSCARATAVSVTRRTCQKSWDESWPGNGLPRQ